MVIRPKYKVPEVVDGSPGAFSRGLAYVELDGVSGYIGRDGTEYFER